MIPAAAARQRQNKQPPLSLWTNERVAQSAVRFSNLSAELPRSGCTQHYILRDCMQCSLPSWT
jgi:hypothetical protein